MVNSTRTFQGNDFLLNWMLAASRCLIQPLCNFLLHHNQMIGNLEGFDRQLFFINIKSVTYVSDDLLAHLA